MVHNNISVPKAIKFLYLKICLKGDAANLIANFKPTAENYEDAVRIILNTYDRPEIIRNRLWDSLVDMSTSSESVIDQRSKLCSIQAIWSQMKSLKEDSGSMGTIRTIIAKFPKRTREKVGGLKKREDPVWTVDDMLNALDTVVGHLELIEDTDPTKDPPSSIASSSYLSPQSPSKTSDRTRVSSGSLSEQRRSRSLSPRTLRSSRTPVRQRYRSPADPCCIPCRYQEHLTEVQALREHTDMDPELRACWKYLQSNHGESECTASPCSCGCKRRHPSLCAQRRDVIQHHTPRTRFRKSRSPRRNEYSSRLAYEHLSRESSRESRHRHRSGRSQSYSPGSSYRQTRGLSHPRRVKFAEHHRNPPLTTQSSACPTRSRKIAVSNRNTDLLPPKNTPRLMVIYVPTVSCKTGTEQLLAVLLDSGAQFSFIRKSLALELGLPFYHSKHITTITFGGRYFSGMTSLVDLILVDKCDEPVLFQLWTIDTITTVPHLGDYNEPSTPTEKGLIEIDVLLGIDHYWQVIEPQNNYRLPSGFILSNTRFGSILSGSRKPMKERSSFTVASVCNITTDVDLSGTEESVRNLLGLDMVALENPNDESLDADVIRQFYETVRVINGSIYVKFPWKSNHPHLGDNKALAFCRLKNQYDRLHTMPSVWQEYCQTFERQLQLGIIEDVTDCTETGPNLYYIPHQAVYKEDSSTTRLRIVFDASSHQRDQPSLNDCLHQGPPLLPDLVGTILRNRFYPYLIIADVEKAFHQIYLHQDQRDATRFLWLKDVNRPPTTDNLRILRFTRVPFGINASPFLLNMSIRYALEQDRENRLKEEILANTYVDNVLIGANSTEECVWKQMECKETFLRMKMNLREFMSNNSRLMRRIPVADRMSEKCGPVKLLGLKWNTRRDTLSVPITIVDEPVCSKRTALKAYASVFDPLGLLIPVLIRAKLFIQELWRKGLSWDEHFSTEYTSEWKRIVQDIAGCQIEVPRFVGLASDSTHDIVICTDASQSVYAVAVYVVSRSSTAEPSSTLLYAKAKVAPPGAVTIPRMELLACHMAARVIRFLRSQLNILLHSIRVLTDSQIALYWIHSSKPLKTFVANRVKYIHEVLDELRSAKIECGFYYISTADNPADCATRGLTATEIKNHRWWSGPSFITSKFPNWPHKSVLYAVQPPSSKALEELKVVSTVQICSSNSFVPYHRTNSFDRLIRIIAYVLKYLSKLYRLARNKRKHYTNESLILSKVNANPFITLKDCSLAEYLVIRQHYREDAENLNNLVLRKFRTEKDEYGMIRVSMRMAHAEIDEKAKRPILILHTHPLSTMIVSNYHHKLLHAGSSHLVSALRRKYFITRVKRLANTCIEKCVVCKRHQGRFYPYPDPPDLPSIRVIRSRPFQHVGLDYFGPILVHLHQEGFRRKVWVCLFTCMSTRALHLEVVNDNSTAQFLLAFRRFMARRGTPDSVLSDNAPTFKLGKEIFTNELMGFEQDALVRKFSLDNGFKWSFITPYSPWKGGIYERLVGSVKACLKKTMLKRILDLRTFETVLFEIEAILNTRPLIPITSSNPDEDIVLRPIDLINPYFRIGRLKDITPLRYDVTANEHHNSIIEHYQEFREILDHFWNLWHKEYLALLAERNVTRSKCRQYARKSPKIGDVVIIRQENIPRSNWPLGLILQLNTSKDGMSRSARIRTGKKTIVERSIKHLVPLEITAEDVSSINQSKRSLTPTRVQPPRAVKRSLSA